MRSFGCESDLYLPQSSRDERANIHTGGICECHDHHFSGYVINGERRAILIDQRKIFNRSSRNAREPIEFQRQYRGSLDLREC